MRVRSLALATTVTAAMAAACLAVPAATAHAAPAAPAAKPYDFNGDGYRDLAVATPKADVDGKARAGNVLALYGSPGGVATTRRTVLSQNTAGIPGSAEVSDAFGTALTSGDLDGDGYADLVVGTPLEDIGGTRTGMVTIAWGGPTGLAYGGIALHYTGVGVSGLGKTLAVGDFDGDGTADLAAGGGQRLFLYEGGFTRTGPAAAPRVLTTATTAGRIVAGDLNGDGRDDLAANDGSGGVLNWYAGSADGLTPKGALGNGTSVADLATDLAVGDLDGDGYADLVVGAPDVYVSGVEDPSGGSGSFTVRYGGPSGPGATRARVLYHQGTPGVPGSDEKADSFAAAVAVGDVTGDGRADVVVGAPYEGLPGHNYAGDVVLFKGTSHGLTTTGAQTVHQGTSGIPGANEAGDHFGGGLALADLDGNGMADLAVSGPGEGIAGGGGYEDGADWVLRGSSGGISSAGALSFSAPAFGFTFKDRKFGSVLG